MTEARKPQRGLQRKAPLRSTGGLSQRKVPAQRSGSLKRSAGPKRTGGLSNRSEGLTRTPMPRGQGKTLKTKTPLQAKKPLQRAPRDRQRSTPPDPRRVAAKAAARAQEDRCRQVVRSRSRGTCEKCGRSGATDAAHRVARGVGGAWDPSNILDLCRACHRHHHEHPQEAYDGGWHLRGETDSRTAPVLLLRGSRWQWVLLDDEGGVTPARGPRDASEFPLPD